MKLIVAIIQDEDSRKLTDRLTDEGISSTNLPSTGGFLSEGNTTLLIGIEQAKVDGVLEIIKQECKSRTKITATPMTTGWVSSVYIPQAIEVPIGGATIFILDVEQFKKL